MDDGRILSLINAIRSPGFKDVLIRLGGYETKETGVQRVLP
jgi:hypothetical protein